MIIFEFLKIDFLSLGIQILFFIKCTHKHICDPGGYFSLQSINIVEPLFKTYSQNNISSIAMYQLDINMNVIIDHLKSSFNNISTPRSLEILFREIFESRYLKDEYLEITINSGIFDKLIIISLANPSPR